MTWSDVGSVDEFPQREPRQIRIGTKACVVVRDGDDLHAMEALCPHKFAPLSEGHIENGCLVCPVHDAYFDLATGTPREGDSWAGHLVRYDARIHEGRVEVDL